MMAAYGPPTPRIPKDKLAEQLLLLGVVQQMVDRGHLVARVQDHFLPAFIFWFGRKSFFSLL